MYGMGNYINWPVCGGSQQIAATQNFAGLSGFRGLGCGCGCGGGCGGGCQKGLGYFDTGWDISGWGWMEWGTVLVGVYMLMSTFQSTKRGARRISKGYRRVRSSGQRRARARADELRREARQLEETSGGSRRRRGGDFF